MTRTNNRALANMPNNFVSVLDYGADPTGTNNSSAAFQSAIDNNSFVYVPPGEYRIETTINVTGNKTITGPDPSNTMVYSSVIRHPSTSTGSVFSVISNQFGGVNISNLMFTGGNGSFCIDCNRSQTTFRNLLMEPYYGGGIKQSSDGTGGWANGYHNIKWVGPSDEADRDYTGIELHVNGGQVEISRCTFIYGGIGVDVIQCEDLLIEQCNFNRQDGNSSLAYDQYRTRCCIRLRKPDNLRSVTPDSITSMYGSYNTGDENNQSIQRLVKSSTPGYKRGVNIRSNYIESYKYGVLAEYYFGLNIVGNYFADVGGAYGGASIKIDPVEDLGCNCEISNNYIGDSGGNMQSINLGQYGKTTVIRNNYISTSGSNSSTFQVDCENPVYFEYNTTILNPYTGSLINNQAQSDLLPMGPSAYPDNLVSTDYQKTGFNCYSNLVNLTGDSEVYIMDATAGKVYDCILFDRAVPDQVYVHKRFIVGTSSVKSIDVEIEQPSYNIRDFEVKSGKIYVKQTDGNSTGNTVIVTKR